MKKLLLLIIPIFILSGCTSTYPEEDLVIHYTRNTVYYEYQEKIMVVIRYSDRQDTLDLRTGGSSDNWCASLDSSHTILIGDFEKVAWYDDNLFILMEGTYYSIDIDEYEIAPLIEDEDENVLSPEYELKEYTETELKQLYPDYESFDWYGH